MCESVAFLLAVGGVDGAEALRPGNQCAVVAQRAHGQAAWQHLPMQMPADVVARLDHRVDAPTVGRADGGAGIQAGAQRTQVAGVVGMAQFRFTGGEGSAEP